jgi:hypothetical protein
MVVMARFGALEVCTAVPGKTMNLPVRASILFFLFVESGTKVELWSWSICRSRQDVQQCKGMTSKKSIFIVQTKLLSTISHGRRDQEWKRRTWIDGKAK